MRETADRVAGGAEGSEAVRLLFDHVRDEVAYEMAPRFDEGRDEWKASATLERGYGFCQQKAVALAALLRARGIPAGIVVQDLQDHKIPPHYVEFIGSQRLEVHGLTCAYVDGDWVRLDPTLPRALCERKRYRLAEYDGDGRRRPRRDRPRRRAALRRRSRSSGRGPTCRTRSSSTRSGSSGSGGRSTRRWHAGTGRGCDGAERARPAARRDRGRAAGGRPARGGGLVRALAAARRGRAAREPLGTGRVALRRARRRRRGASTTLLGRESELPSGNAELLAARDAALADLAEVQARGLDTPELRAFLVDRLDRELAQVRTGMYR